MATHRRPVYINPGAQQWTSTPRANLDEIYTFHQGFPGYRPSELISLEDLAEELGIGKIYLKHEGDRLGLPSFKILGASWGTYQAILRRYQLPQGSDFEAVRAKTAQQKVLLTAATDGNHGRAVARLGRIFDLPVNIYVPACMESDAIANLEQEGARVINTGKPYDAAIMDAAEAAKAADGLLIQDCAFEGYEEVPQWIVAGYTTCLREIEDQLGQQSANLVIVPSGVGSLAQAVVDHCRREGSETAILAVEPDTAACLWKSLQKTQSTSIETTATIMAGLDCGTVSTTAWPTLRAGISACATVADYEAHKAVKYLEARGIHSGPCGAASLAALRRLDPHEKQNLGLGKNSIVVLLSTEASRPYDTPQDVGIEDCGRLAELLVSIYTRVPRQNRGESAAESQVARYLMAWLEHRDIQCCRLESGSGPLVLGIVPGTECGLDRTVTLSVSLRVKPSQKGRRDVGPDAVDGAVAAKMGDALASNMLALSRARDLRLRENVILVATTDKNHGDISTIETLAADICAGNAVLERLADLNMVDNEVKGDCPGTLQMVGLQ